MLLPAQFPGQRQNVLCLAVDLKLWGSVETVAAR